MPNPCLKHELDSLYYADQLYRAAMFADNKQHLIDSLAAAQHFPAAEAPQHLIGLMLQADSADYGELPCRLYAMMLDR